jgi:hypothetical protein
MAQTPQVQDWMAVWLGKRPRWHRYAIAAAENRPPHVLTRLFKQGSGDREK